MTNILPLNLVSLRTNILMEKLHHFLKFMRIDTNAELSLLVYEKIRQ